MTKIIIAAKLVTIILAWFAGALVLAAMLAVHPGCAKSPPASVVAGCETCAKKCQGCVDLDYLPDAVAVIQLFGEIEITSGTIKLVEVDDAFEFQRLDIRSDGLGRIKRRDSHGVTNKGKFEQVAN